MRIRLAAMFCLSAVLGAAQADPAALLDRAATKMREAKTFRMAGVTVIEYLSRQKPATDTLRFRLLLGDRPQRARLDLLSGMPVSRVCGGPKSLTYFEDTNEVFSEQHGASAWSCYLTILEWANSPDNLSGLKLGGTMQIAVDGGRRDCTVVTGAGQAPAASNLAAGAGLPVLTVIGGPPRGLRSLCIDPGTGDVLWYQAERTLSGNERVRETTTFSHFEYGAAVIPEDFEVEIPTDAKESRNARDRAPWPRQ